MALFRTSRAVDPEGARRELAGDLDGALHVYLRDDAAGDACRVLLALADREPDPAKRLDWVARAALLAGDDRRVRARYAEARVDLARAVPSSMLPSEAAAVARELLELDAPVAAARAFRVADMAREEADAWAAAGDVERTEEALARELVAARDERALVDLAGRFELLVRTGQRLAAVELVRRDPLAGDALARRASAIDARLCRWPRVCLRVGGVASTWVLGASVVLGRTGCDVDVSAPAVSRRHLSLSRDAAGRPVVEDLGSSNGTFLAAMRLARPLVIDHEVELKLGADVAIVLRAEGGALSLRVGGVGYTLPLGPARVGGAELVRAGEHVRLVSSAGVAPRLGGVAVPEGVDLLDGDRVRVGDVDIDVGSP